MFTGIVTAIGTIREVRKTGDLHAVISSCVYAVQDHRELQITMQVPEDLNVLADEVELARVISNLLENARRYGKTPDTASTRVEIAAKAREDWVLIKLRDHGTGVPPEQLANLTKPFFRGDSARTAAAGAGLGPVAGAGGRVGRLMSPLIVAAVSRKLPSLE